MKRTAAATAVWYALTSTMIPGIAQGTKDERVCRLKKDDDEMKKARRNDLNPATCSPTATGSGLELSGF